MKKLLIIVACIASMAAAGCSRYSLVHRIDIQQGNVVTREQVAQLETGMNRGQVQFLMGSPMVVDVFHQDRWDYIYLLKPGYGEPREQRVTLFFENDRLVRIDSTLEAPDPDEEDDTPAGQTTVVVPPEVRVEPGLFNRIWHWITFRNPDTDLP